MLLELSLRLNDHRATRPLALLMHLVLHHHRANDDCPRCLDLMR